MTCHSPRKNRLHAAVAEAAAFPAKPRPGISGEFNGIKSRPANSAPRGSAAPKAARVVVVGDTVVSEQGLVAIISRDKRYAVCGAAHTFHDANDIIRQQQPQVLLIEPFVENRDGIRWIKDLVTEFPLTRILIVSRKSEQLYAERALRSGASGYCMTNSRSGNFG